MYESIPEVGAAISSEQIGEIIYSRLERVWIFPPRREQKILFTLNILDRMVTYNFNFKWDRALRSDTENLEKYNEEIYIDEELIEDDGERVELHNRLIDSDFKLK